MSSEEAREILEMDVVFVGAGPASLAGAYRLATLLEEHNAQAAEPIDIEIAVLEKGQTVGAHPLSGAVFDPVSLAELFPDTWQDAPLEAPVGQDDYVWLTEKGSFTLPTPPGMSNSGYHVASIGKLSAWLAERCEEKGVSVFPEFPASEILVEDGRVIGVRTGDKGIGHDGEKKANYEPGMDIHTRVTVLGEGVRGNLTKQLDRHLDLWAGKNPQVYAIGIKELWELPEGRIAPGRVMHTMNWPLGKDIFGGGFVYGMKDDVAIVGLVVGLDYENPWVDPHDEFNRFKTHPVLRELLEGGKMVNYGAKAIPEGGWFSMPRYHGDGFALIGDAAGFLNSQKLKGISLAMKSGMLAAEAIVECLEDDDFSERGLSRYKDKVEASWLKKDLWKVRNFHQAFEKGLFGGIAQAGLGMLTGGRGWGIKNRLEIEAGHEQMERLNSPQGRHHGPRPAPEPDGELTHDRLSDVYNSGTAHTEDQPSHLLVHDPEICVTRCAEEFANPCERFCPAEVYEIVDDADAPHGKRLQINFSNCVHCKTCDIMDPYQIIDWVPPEGGGGPNYGKM